MSGLDERRNGFEQKFVHDETLRFRVNARRNKLLGLWAAEKLGKIGEAATRYAGEVVAADSEAPGGAAVLRKVTDELGIAEAVVRAKMETLLEEAGAQITAENSQTLTP